MNKKYIKILSFLLSIAMLCSLLTFPTTATADTVTLGFANGRWEETDGIQSYYVDVIASADENFDLYSAQIYINFNPDVLTFISATNKLEPVEITDEFDEVTTYTADLTTTPRDIANANGCVTLVFADTQAYNHSITSGQTLATLRFFPTEGATDSSTTLNFQPPEDSSNVIGYYNEGNQNYAINATATMPVFIPNTDTSNLVTLAFANGEWETVGRAQNYYVDVIASADDDFNMSSGQISVSFNKNTLTFISATNRVEDTTETDDYGESTTYKLDLTTTPRDTANANGCMTMTFADTQAHNHTIKSGQTLATLRFALNEDTTLGTTILTFSPPEGSLNAMRYYDDDEQSNEQDYVLDASATHVVTMLSTEELPVLANITLSESTVAWSGENITVQATATGMNDENITDKVIWGVDPINKGITVNKNGEVIITADAEARIYWITATPDERNTMGSAKSASLIIVAGKPRLASVTLSQDKVTLYGGEVEVQATATNTTDEDVTDQVTWSVLPVNNGVTIDESGKVTIAPDATTGTYQIIALPNSTELIGDSKYAALTVSPIPTLANVTLSESSFTLPSEDIEVQATATDSNDVDVTDQVTWSITPTDSGITVDENGKVTITPDAEIETYSVIATPDGTNILGNEKSASLTITEPFGLPTLASITLDQSSAALSPSNVEVQATARDSNDTNVTNKVTWSVRPADKGVTMGEDGKIIVTPEADTETTYRIIATPNGIDVGGTAKIVLFNVLPMSTLASITLSQSNITSSTEDITVQATAIDSNGADVTNKVVWTLDPADNGVTINRNGRITVTPIAEVGTVYRIIATPNNANIAGTAKIASLTILPTPTLANITLSQSEVMLSTGNIEVQATATSTSGMDITDQVRWSIDPSNHGVRVDASGKITVTPMAEVNSVYQIIAVPNGTTVLGDTDIASLTILPTPTLSYIALDKPSVSVKSSNVTVQATAIDISDTDITDQVTWSIEPADNKVRIDNSGKITVTTAAEVGSVYQIIATPNGVNILGTAQITSLTISEPSLPTLTRVTLPKTSIALESGNVEIQATATDSEGANVTNRVTWSVNPADKGVTVTASGKVIVSPEAEVGGFYYIAAMPDGKNVSGAQKGSTITILSPVSFPALANVTLSQSVIAPPTENVEIQATAISDHGANITAKVNWSVNPADKGVTVDAGGRVTITPSVDQSVTYQIIATPDEGKVTGDAKNAVLTISESALNPTLANVTLSQSTFNPATTTGEIQATATNSNGVNATSNVAWTVTPANQGVTIDESGKITIASSATRGIYQITATPDGTNLSGTAKSVDLSILDNTAASIIFKHYDGTEEVLQYTASNTSNWTFPTDVRSGYVFSSWTIEGATYTSMTSELLASILGQSVIATPNFTVRSSGGGGGGGGGGGSSRSSGGSSSSVSYTIRTSNDISHGSVTPSATTARSGATIVINVTPDSGYVLDELSVTDNSNKSVTLSGGNNVYAFTMPSSNVVISATFKSSQDSSQNTPTPSNPSNSNTPTYRNPFIDVPNSSYYYDAVLWAVNNNITNGTTPSTFSPAESCTRAQMVTFLWRAAGSPRPSSSYNPFSDVYAGWYYYDAVLWAVEQGITNGTGAYTFSPDAIVDRAQVVTFLYRKNGSYTRSYSNPFYDVQPGWYYDAVLWAVDNNITNGTSSTTFSPTDSCTRAQIVTLLYRSMTD